MFKTAFNQLHEHSHTGMKITYNTFKQYYYVPFLEKWLSIFIRDCNECQRNKHFNMKIQTAPTQSFSEHAPYFNYRISMDTKGPNNPPSHNKSYIHVIIDAFSHFVVTVPSNHTTQRLLSKLSYTIGLLNLDHLYILSLIVDQNMLIKEWHTFVHLWEFVILLEQLTLLWTNGLVEVQNQKSWYPSTNVLT